MRGEGGWVDGIEFLFLEEQESRRSYYVACYGNGV